MRLLRAESPPSTQAATALESAVSPEVYTPICDYGVIGDCRTIALISKSGSIDWLCVPRFDSPSLFAALLDARVGGRFQIRPAVPFKSSHRYLEDTNVLETTFTTDHGVLRVTDCMSVAEAAHRRQRLVPDHEVLRKVECVDGSVDVEVTFDPRPDYGRAQPRVRRDRSSGALVVTYRGQSFALQSDIALDVGSKDVAASGTERLNAGDVRWLSFTAEEGPAVFGGLGADADRRMLRTIQWWRDWRANCRYEGPYADAVVRSLLVLKLLSYSPSGAIVAAGTTSLPEELGGSANWDYRFCWLRDASLTLRALFDLGLTDDGEGFLSWMLHATRLTWPRLQVLYTVFGEARIDEHVLPHLEGYRRSQPVRIGNGAHRQVQNDVYGEVIAAAYDYVCRGGELDPRETKMIRGLGDSICHVWDDDDNGIWEFRSGVYAHTLTKALCWVGLDRLLSMDQQGKLALGDARRRKYRDLRDRIRAVIEQRGWSDAQQSYTAVLDGEEVDASLLLMPLFGYGEPDSERMLRTHARIRQVLEEDGLLYRYEADRGTQGAFGICSFWSAEFLADADRVDEAKRVFEHVLSYANDLGLFAEQFEPGAGTALGNFPQAFTHVGLINAAVAIARHAPDERAPSPAETAVTGSRRKIPKEEG